MYLLSHILDCQLLRSHFVLLFNSLERKGDKVGVRKHHEQEAWCGAAATECCLELLAVHEAKWDEIGQQQRGLHFNTLLI